MSQTTFIQKPSSTATLLPANPSFDHEDNLHVQEVLTALMSNESVLLLTIGRKMSMIKYCEAKNIFLQVFNKKLHCSIPLSF